MKKINSLGVKKHDVGGSVDVWVCRSVEGKKIQSKEAPGRVSEPPSGHQELRSDSLHSHHFQINHKEVNQFRVSLAWHFKAVTLVI